MVSKADGNSRGDVLLHSGEGKPCPTGGWPSRRYDILWDSGDTFGLAHVGSFFLPAVCFFWLIRLIYSILYGIVDV